MSGISRQYKNLRLTRVKTDWKLSFICTFIKLVPNMFPLYVMLLRIYVCPFTRVTLYTAGHLHTAVPHCSHSRAPIVHTAVPRENNEHGCVYLRCRAVCKLPGCVEGHPCFTESALLNMTRCGYCFHKPNSLPATHPQFHFKIPPRHCRFWYALQWQNRVLLMLIRQRYM